MQEAKSSGCVGVQLMSVDSRELDGQLTQSTLGNGVVTKKTYDVLGRVQNILATNASGAHVQNYSPSFDAVGNLTARADSASGLNENFAYDTLNRVTQVSGVHPLALSGVEGTSLTMSYSAGGNITSKSDVGAYTYQPNSHRLASVGGRGGYAYDGNGNLTQAGGSSVATAAFDLPITLTNGGTSLTWEYGEGHERVKEVSTGGSHAGTTIYVSTGGFEIYTPAPGTQGQCGSQTEYRHTLQGPDGPLGQMLLCGNGADPSTTRLNLPLDPRLQYHAWHSDHLGSILAETQAAGGDIIARYYFDAWGKRTLLMGDGQETRGYTGHEMLEEVGLIHMNGRLYDPQTGRFVQADPIIQAPYNGQNYNRYSYVLNNPLSLTDPSGFSWWTQHRGYVQAVVAVVVAYYTAGAASSWASGVMADAATSSSIAEGGTAFASVATYSGGEAVVTLTPLGSAVAGAAGGAAAGFAAGGIMGGNLNSALQGAVTGAVSGGVGGYYGNNYTLDRVAAETAVGGINSRIQGGSFAQGAKMGFIFSGATYVAANTREIMVNFAKAVPGNIGYSPGAFGIPGRIGGEIISADDWKRVNGLEFNVNDPKYSQHLENYWASVKGGPFGGVQGRNPGTLFGFKYPPGGIVDKVVESFGGFHDWLNKPLFYTTDTNSQFYGTSHNFLHSASAAAHWAGETLSAINVLVASPVVGAAMVPDYLRSIPFHR